MSGHALDAIEEWDVFELRIEAASLPENPFRDVTFYAEFIHEQSTVRAGGFYDGAGIFCVRFSPDAVGNWRYRTSGSLQELDGHEGNFTCTPPKGRNHGPVHVSGTHFAYADGTPFFSLGTTAYAWTYQDEALTEATLDSLVRYDFNKVRMLVFPKEYGTESDLFRIDYSPAVLPFEGEPGNLDFTRPNPEYFRRYDRRVLQLRDRGVQADVILFHPYDRTLWGIPQGMSPDDDRLYLRYIIARLSAYRNVWWSLANEYDLFGISAPEGPPFNVKRKDWDAIGELIAETDPSRHLRSIHNWTWGPIYPNREWMTHVSYQHPNTWSLAITLRDSYRKPVVNDEYQYEGNVGNDYGNATAELEVKRHWMACMAGAYASHGEMYVWAGDRTKVFWTTGGTLVGQSPPRLSYLRQIMESLPFDELLPNLQLSDGVDFFCLSKRAELFVYFFGPAYKDRPGMQLGTVAVDETTYELTVHDVWQCRTVSMESHCGGNVTLSRMPRWCVVVARRVPATDSAEHA